MQGLAESGRQRRLGAILRPPRGRTVIVAVDHGQFMGPVPGALVLRDTVDRVVAGSPDAIQLTPGGVRRCADVPGFDAVPLVLRLDTTNVWRTNVLAPSPGYWRPLAEPADAVACGASAAVAFLLGGWRDDALEGDNLRQLAAWSRECSALGMPLIIEPLPLSGKLETDSDAALVRTLARIAVETGCDMLKLDYSGDPDGFGELVRDAGVPVLARGGPRADSPADYLRGVEVALDAGAAGVVVGRNVFAHEQPTRILHQLREVVHGSDGAHGE